MILRIFQVVVRPGKEADFADVFHNTAVPPMTSTEGIVSVLPGAARPESPRHFSFVMVWNSLDALKALVGEDCESPHIDPAEAELVNARSIRQSDLVEA